MSPGYWADESGVISFRCYELNQRTVHGDCQKALEYGYAQFYPGRLLTGRNWVNIYLIQGDRHSTLCAKRVGTNGEIRWRKRLQTLPASLLLPYPKSAVA